MKKLVIFFLSIIFVLLLLFYGVGLKIGVARGTSMLPTLKDNHIVINKKINCDELQENDIGIYRNPETMEYISHRVIYKTGSGYIFKGDNNMFYDDFVPKEWVEFKVIMY